MKAPRFSGSLLASLALPFLVSAGEPADRFVTLENRPLGTREQPLLLRTYLPDPGLSREVLANHSLGFRARKYTPGKGDVEGFVDPIPGIPAAIAVSFGPDLSLCWDTTECRLLYAWKGGFVDMTNYWGKPEDGRRKGFAYLPELVGELIYLAQGSPPLALLDHYHETQAPVFRGYRLVNGTPEFSYSISGVVVHVRIQPGPEPLSIEQHFRIEGGAAADYHESGYKAKLSETVDGAFTVAIQGKAVAAGARPDQPEFSTSEPNPAWGESLYTSLGCMACHSLDGSRGHGPTFSGLYGAERAIAGLKTKVIADEAYLTESITQPVAKVVEGFPPGYMPPYVIEEKQLRSLVLFLKTLGNE